MELIMSVSPDGKFRQMYQYHKVGCPIAWISGLLNRETVTPVLNVWNVLQLVQMVV